MKLLYIHDKPLDSGKANVIQVLHMCAEFANQGVDVTLAIPYSYSEDKANRIARSILGYSFNFAISPYFKPDLRGRLSLVGSYFPAKRVVREHMADIIYVRTPVVLLAVNSQRNSNTPVIYESHNGRIHRNPLLNLFLTKRLLRICKSSKVLCFVTISQALAEYWLRMGVPKPKAIALHDAVDFERSSIGKRVRDEEREHLDIALNQRVALYAGSLYPDRGIERLLNLARAFPDDLFIVIGGPDHRVEYYRSLFDEADVGNLRLIGYVDHQDMARYLAAADVLLMLWTDAVPTINYCSPLKLFEYMAAGRVIVGEAFPTICEVLTDGVDAFLAVPGELEDLESKLGKAFKMGRDCPMAFAAQELARREYTWQKRVQRILTLLASFKKV